MFQALPTSWRWTLWMVYAVAWTFALLMPFPSEAHWSIADLEINRKFLFAKTLHVSAYAFFAVLTAWLHAPMRLRFFLMFFLMAHGTMTEVLQYSIEFIGRSGGLFDVGLDHCGIAIGTLLSWKWWTGGDSEPGAPSPTSPQAPGARHPF
jgi:hypothetical protein